jgi:hypothetical protein
LGIGFKIEVLITLKEPALGVGKLKSGMVEEK